MLKPKEHQTATVQKQSPHSAANYKKKVTNSKVNDVLGKIAQVQKTTNPNRQGHFRNASFQDSFQAQNERALTNYERIQLLQTEGMDLTNYQKNITKQALQIRHEQSVRLQNKNKDIKAIDQSGGQSLQKHNNTTRIMPESRITEKHETSLRSSLHMDAQSSNAYKPIVKVSGLPIENGMPEAPVDYQEAIQSNRIGFDQEDSIQTPWPILENSKELASPFQINNTAEDDASSPSVLEQTLQANSKREKQDVVLIDPETGVRPVKNYFDNNDQVNLDNPNNPKKLEIKVQSNMNLNKVANSPDPGDFARDIQILDKVQIDAKPNTAQHNRRNHRGRSNNSVNPASPIAQPFSNGSPLNFQVKHDHFRNTNMSGQSTNMATYYVNQRQLIQTAGENKRRNINPNQCDLTSLNQQTFMNRSKLSNKQPKTSNFEGSQVSSDPFAKNAMLQDALSTGNTQLGNVQIHSRLYSRDGSINDRGTPFFIEQIHKERMIRTNKSFRRRNNTRFKSNCVPLGSNYINDRILINKKHFEKCKGRQMVIFERDMVNQQQQMYGGLHGFESGTGDNQIIVLRQDQGVQLTNQSTRGPLSVDGGKQMNLINTGDGLISGFDVAHISNRMYSNNSNSHRSQEGLDIKKLFSTNWTADQPKIINHDHPQKTELAVYGLGKQMTSVTPTLQQNGGGTSCQSPQRQTVQIFEKYSQQQESPHKTLYRKDIQRIKDQQRDKSETADGRNKQQTDQQFELAVFNSFNLEENSLFVQNQNKQVKYQPIQGRLQRLSSQQLVMAKLGSRELKQATSNDLGATSSPKMSSKNTKSNQQSRNAKELKIQTGNLKVQSQQKKKSEPRMKESLKQESFVMESSFNGGHHYILAPKQQKPPEKPLWVCNKKPKSRVVNYKSMEGRRMKKLSAGDPGKQEWQKMKDALKTQVLHPILSRDQRQQEEMRQAEQKLNQIPNGQGGKIVYGLKDLKVGIQPSFAPPGQNRTILEDFENLNISASEQREKDYLQSIRGATPDTNAVHGGGSQAASCGIDEIPTVQQEIDIKNTFQRNKESFETVTKNINTIPSQPLHTLQSSQPMLLKSQQPTYTPRIDEIQNQGGFHLEDENHKNKERSSLELGATSAVPETTRTRQQQFTSSTANLNSLPLDNSIIAKRYETLDKQMKANEMSPNEKKIMTLGEQTSKKSKTTVEHMSFGKNKTPFNGFQNDSNQNGSIHMPQSQPMSTPADLSGRTSMPMRDYSNDEKKDLETISQNLSNNANNRSPSVDNKSHQSKVVYQRKTEPTSQLVITSKEEELFEMESKENQEKDFNQNTKNSSQELIQGLLSEPGKHEDNQNPMSLTSAVSKKERVSNIQGPSLDISVIQENDHFEMCEMIGTVVVNSTFEKANQIITDNSAAFKQKQLELQQKVDSQLSKRATVLTPKSRKNDTDRYEHQQQYEPVNQHMQACAEGFMIQQIKRSEFTSPANKMVDQSAGQTTSGKRQVNVAHQNTSRPRDSVSTINQQLGQVSKFRQNSPRASQFQNQQQFNLDNKVSVMSEKYMNQGQDDHTPATIYVKDHSRTQDQSMYNSMQASFLEQKNEKKPYNLSQILSDHNKQQDYIESQIGDKKEDLRFGPTATMNQNEIETRAQSNVNEKTRQPIHRNPPKYLQKENFGMKFAYQQTMQQRIKNRKSESFGGSHIYNSYRSGKQESLMSTARGENVIVVEKEALNIRNLCNQKRSKTSNGGKYGRLKAVGIVQEDQQGKIQNLSFEQNSQIGSIFEKEQHFYQTQMDQIQCPKAKNLVSPACDPAYKVIQSSQLTPRTFSQDQKKKGLVQNRKEKIDVRTSMHFKKNSQCSNMQNTSYDGEQSQNKIQAADVSVLLKDDKQTFSVNQIQATQKKQGLATEVVYDYGESGPATNILQPQQPYQGQMSKTGSFESRETPFNNREEPMLEPTMTNDELKQISTTRQQMSTTRNQASTNRRISTTRHPGFKVKHSFDSRKESKMSSSYPTPLPQPQPHIVDIVASDSRMSQGHGLSYTQQAAILQQYGNQDNMSKNHQTGVSRNSLHDEPPSNNNCKNKKTVVRGNKSNFKQGVHRDFRGLIDPLKIEGIIDKTDNHLKQFKRQRSNTLVKQLTNKRKGIKSQQGKQRSKSNGTGVLVLLSNTNHLTTEQQSLIQNQEFIHPLKLIQDAQSELGQNDRVAESNSYADISQQNANKDLQDSQLSQRSQHLFATKKMITEKKVTANFEMNNSRERGDTGKITIDSVGIKELYSAQDMTDEYSNEMQAKKRNEKQKQQMEDSNWRKQQKSYQEPTTPVGERELFDLPTSVVEDLIAEQKEQNEKEIINFGLIGKTTELRPLPENQEKAHAPLQNFFKTKQNVTLRKEPSDRKHTCQKFEMAQKRMKEQRDGLGKVGKYPKYSEAINGAKSVPVSLSLNGTTSRMSDAYSNAHTPQTKVMANYGQLSIKNSDGDMSPEKS